MNFVRIENVFTGEKDRTIEILSKVYNDNEFLKEKIRLIVNGILDSSAIKGKKVLLKPNWVLQNKVKDDEICLRTNNSFLLAALEVLLEKKPASIIIGDAPIQSCNWEKMLSKPFLRTIVAMSAKYSLPIAIKDFRRVTFDPSQNILTKERKPLSNYIIFDVGKESYLEPISSIKNNFRVIDYAPDRLANSHSIGMHKYCIAKEFFEVDIVISMPKIKTHQKAGITGTLKNLVGLNGDKDYLPHHRVGGVGFGGDCYPGKNILRRTSEWALDMANKQQGKKVYRFLRLAAIVFWKLSIPKKVHQLDAGWFGNDTVWRMVLDLNKIAIFGKEDGTLSNIPQRELYSLCDGIIGGQGNGPLNPTPLPLGVICFSNNSPMSDICMASLMGFDYRLIPLLANISNNDMKSVEILLNEKKVSLNDLSKMSIDTLPPPGWVDYFGK